MVDNAFDLFVIDTYRMVTHKKGVIIIVKLLYRAIDQAHSSLKFDNEIMMSFSWVVDAVEHK